MPPHPFFGAAALKTSRAFWILLCSGEAFIPSSRNHFLQCQALLNKIIQQDADGARESMEGHLAEVRIRLNTVLAQAEAEDPLHLRSVN